MIWNTRGFKKFLIASLVMHVAVISALFLNGSPNLEVDEIPKPAMNQPVKAIISSTAIDTATLNDDIAKYKKLKSQQEAIESKQSKALERLKKEAAKLEADIKSKKKQEVKLDKEIRRQKDQLEKKRNADAAKERERLKRAAEAKDRSEQERLEKEKELQRIESLKSVNSDVLSKLKARNIKEQERIKNELRASYEGLVHEVFFEAWSLPFERSKVNCQVEVNVSRSGSVTGYQFVSDCPASYRETIRDAIDNVGKLPTTDKEIYRPVELVNFIDN